MKTITSKGSAAYGWLVEILQQHQNPYRTIAFAFLFTMLAGSFLLMLPIATREGQTTTYVDALFTSVSAVAITGLSPVDVHLHWTLFGQVIIVFLIQLGGLGVLTFTTLVAVILGRKIGVQARLNLQTSMDEHSLHGMVRLVIRIVGLTFAMEGVGAVLYAIQLYPYLGSSAIYYGIFQSISAFCNAGFVFFDNALVYEMVDDTFFSFHTSVLIIIGGIGYSVLFDLYKNRNRSFHWLSLQSKIMLVGTGLLISFGFFFILLVEWNNVGTIGNLSFLGKVDAALLQAVTPRTAGLATVDYTAMHTNTVLLTIFLMFLGGGPGSTAGGIKITAAAILLVSSLSICLGHREVRVFKRTISPDLQHRAMAGALFASLFLSVGTFLLASFEDAPILAIVFEVVSAFSNVGLSMNLTPTLSVPSKLVLIILMYAGRIGVMTLIASFIMKNRRIEHIRYPHENIML